MPDLDLFHVLVACHICTGAIGLVAFWVPVSSTKGGSRHVRYGRVFTNMMIFTGFFAVGIALTTLTWPLETHPKFDDAALVRGIFGWMMLYLALLTINLGWYGWQVAMLKRAYAGNFEWRNILLQVLVAVSALNCLIQGLLIGQVLMIAISFVGFATVATNMWFLMKKAPGPFDWQLEHVKALVGAGISVYTAFLAFGAVRLMPQAALSPVLWSIPLATGIGLIIYHQRKIRMRYARKSAAPSRASATSAGVTEGAEGTPGAAA
ncbi:MAG: hypothetical protein AAGM04_04685 [Pseudomonadota bacterium]